MQWQHCLHVLANLQVTSPEQAKKSILQSLQGVKVSLTIVSEAEMYRAPGTRLYVLCTCRAEARAAWTSSSLTLSMRQLLSLRRMVG